MLLCALVATSAFGGACGERGERDLDALLEDGDLSPWSLSAAPGDDSGGAAGLWTFDDCSVDRTELSDASGYEHLAYRSVSTTCGEGVDGQGIRFANRDDVVFVPDQPNFVFTNGVTAGAWVNPTALRGVQSLFRKREGGSSSFLLLINGNKFQFVVQLVRGAVAVSAPATAGKWTHVVGTYDGGFVRLFIDGLEAANVKAAGRIVNGAGPLLLGNDANHRRLIGSIDDALFDTVPTSVEAIRNLACVHRPMSATVTALSIEPSLPGSAVPFDLAVTSNNSASCPDEPIQFNAPASNGFVVSPDSETLFVPGDQTRHLTVQVTSPDDWPAGSVDVPFLLSASDGTYDSLDGTFTYVIAPSTGCHVSPSHELMITDLSVVTDGGRVGGAGPWSFARLMQNLAPTPDDAPTMVENLLRTWLTDQTVNGFTIPARGRMFAYVINPFPRLGDGRLDLTRAPVRLLAIVNRIDMRDPPLGKAGQARFIFGVVLASTFDGEPPSYQFTMSFDFDLPGSTPEDVLDWANKWHALGALTLGTEEFNASLQDITDGFTGRGMMPERPNGSALAELRTHEFDLGFSWQFRAFALSPSTGMLQPIPLSRTPDLSLRGTVTLANFVNANEEAIIAETHAVPAIFDGAAFLTGSIISDNGVWNTPGINNNEARFHFAINTCNGCHSSSDSAGSFDLHVSPRVDFIHPSSLSPFLTGATVADPVTGQVRTFQDLHRRRLDLEELVCPPAAPAP